MRQGEGKARGKGGEGRGGERRGGEERGGEGRGEEGEERVKGRGEGDEKGKNAGVYQVRTAQRADGDT